VFGTCCSLLTRAPPLIAIWVLMVTIIAVQSYSHTHTAYAYSRLGTGYAT